MAGAVSITSLMRFAHTFARGKMARISDIMMSANQKLGSETPLTEMARSI